MNPPLPLVCFAVREEAAVFRKMSAATRVDILVTSMGKANAAQSIRAALASNRPSLVITSGFAGGLNPQLSTGDVVFSADDYEIQNRLIAAGAREGRFHFADHVAVTAQEKWSLWQQTGADAVEMESQIIRDICRAQTIPSATVRVILDQAGEDLPLNFNALMTPDMKLDSSKLALAILKSPGKIAALRRLQKQSKAAAGKLAQVLEAFV